VIDRWRAVVVLVVCACACIAVAVVNRHVYPPPVGGVPGHAERAGWTEYAPLDVSSASPSRFDSFELWDPYLWVGAGVTLLIVAVCVVVFSLRRRRA
jgi:heme/copper-type cytochrome/quinol oxidase subunit 1